MPGGALGRHPDLTRGAMRVQDVSSAVAKLDRENVACELGFYALEIERVERVNQRPKLGKRLSFVIGLGQHSCQASLGGGHALGRRALVARSAISIRLARPCAFAELGIASMREALRVRLAGKCHGVRLRHLPTRCGCRSRGCGSRSRSRSSTCGTRLSVARLRGRLSRLLLLWVRLLTVAGRRLFLLFLAANGDCERESDGRCDSSFSHNFPREVLVSLSSCTFEGGQRFRTSRQSCPKKLEVFARHLKGREQCYVRVLAPC